MLKYPSKLPLIIEAASDQKNHLEQLTNPKFMIPKNFRVGDLQQIIRKHLKLEKDHALFLLASGTHVLK